MFLRSKGEGHNFTTWVSLALEIQYPQITRQVIDFSTLGTVIKFSRKAVYFLRHTKANNCKPCFHHTTFAILSGVEAESFDLRYS